MSIGVCALVRAGALTVYNNSVRIRPISKLIMKIVSVNFIPIPCYFFERLGTHKMYGYKITDTNNGETEKTQKIVLR